MQILSQSEPRAARFTRRVSFYEEPDMVAAVEELARDSGRSTAAEIRAAIRYWLRANEGNE